ncbi:MAG: acetylornithine/succinylornithine family transaminase [Eggerthellaceae bacterium]|nr:acetylornithine/succinylornithine family transaminase [Eggerthellaceae bacterium]
MAYSHEYELDAQYIMPTFARKPIEFVRGNGMQLFDDKGGAYLDFIGGIGVNCLGHSHPDLTAALQKQAETLLHVSNYYYIPGRGDLARKVNDLLNFSNNTQDTWKVFFANSGAEANEAAVKIARLHAKRTGKSGGTILSIQGSFHGRTLATLAATAQPLKQEDYKPLPAGFISTPLNDISALRETFAQHGNEICGVLIEVIQGESGIHPATQEFLEEVRTLTETYDALMMCDEVQSGVFRCGVPFAFQAYGIVPDVVSIAKGIGGGVPMGMCAARNEIADTFQPGDHGTTFGGSCLAVVAANTVLDVIERDNIAKNVKEVGAYLREQLSTLPHIKEVRGLGLMVAAEFDDSVDAPQVVFDALKIEQGLILNYTGKHTLRFLPPLVAKKADIDILMSGLKKLLL